MTVHIVTHEACLGHEGGPGHPERPDRLRTIYDLLRDADGDGGARLWRDGGVLAWHEAPEVTREDLERVHPGSYVDEIRDTSLSGGGALDPDTSVNTLSWDAALRAAGAAVRGVELALSGEGNAFVPVRPPGHHALAARAMGFCLFGNVVVAAQAARARGAARKVLIVDWDVHHGNGTQALVERQADIHFVSLHQWPLYPGTGREDERGVGNVWNVPRPPGRPPGEYVTDLLAAIDAATEGFAPDLVLISAGFDAMRGDPLAGFTLEAEHYPEIVRRLRELQAPIVAVLEGGYHLDNLRRGVDATLRELA